LNVPAMISEKVCTCCVYNHVTCLNVMKNGELIELDPDIGKGFLDDRDDFIHGDKSDGDDEAMKEYE
jgi:hypothetical protein